MRTRRFATASRFEIRLTRFAYRSKKIKFGVCNSGGGRDAFGKEGQKSGNGRGRRQVQTRDQSAAAAADPYRVEMVDLGDVVVLEIEQTQRVLALWLE